jgi:zinc transport system ATP-binding protein
LHLVANKMELPQIEIKDISFSYEKEVVINNISFDIKKGDYLGIIGPNGGGKTTLVKIILGLLPPQKGSVTVRGKCGYVPQKAAQEISGLPATVREIIESGRESNKQRIKEAMEITEIEKYEDRLISELSGGERQRVFIARALVKNPDILILDEPSTGVDVATQEKFYSFLKKINEKEVTIIFVSHDINVIANEAKNVLCLGGEKTCFGSPQETLTDKNIENLYGRKVKFFLHKH